MKRIVYLIIFLLSACLAGMVFVIISNKLILLIPSLIPFHFRLMIISGIVYTGIYVWILLRKRVIIFNNIHDILLDIIVVIVAFCLFSTAGLCTEAILYSIIMDQF